MGWEKGWGGKQGLGWEREVRHRGWGRGQGGKQVMKWETDGVETNWGWKE